MCNSEKDDGLSLSDAIDEKALRVQYIYIYTYTHIYIYTYTHTHTYIYTHTYTNRYICAYICACSRYSMAFKKTYAWLRVYMIYIHIYHFYCFMFHM